MLILGIESSCDETAAAIVKNGKEVLSSKVYTQIETHQLFGGVVPEVAAREHLKVIDPIVKSALDEADCSLNDIDAIAVTQGPGLIGALLVGISYAKGLALASSKPLIPVNHVNAHVHGALLGLESEDIFPCISLVVSGGHTNLYYMKSPTHFELLANSLDDACGESFDKVAKLFKLGYPGGPAIEQKAKQGNPSNFKMPKMMNNSSNLGFSYSGLKTYMVNLRHRHKADFTEQELADLCSSFQEEALGQLVRMLKLSSKQKDVKTILVAGGVAANQRFRDMVKSEIDLPALFPNLKYCSDNAAMIATLGYYLHSNSRNPSEFLSYEWDAFSRYNLS